jgi:predicted transcriptional regulator
MIDFACKQFKTEELVKCALGLSKADVRVLNFFMKNIHEYYNAEEISSSLDLHLSTAQRAVKKLHGKSVLIRKQENLEDGGYVYSYQMQSKKKVTEIIMNIIHVWMGNVEENLRRW